MPRYKRSGFTSSTFTLDWVARELDKISAAIDAIYNGEIEEIREMPTGDSPLLIYSDGSVDLGDGKFGLYLRHNGNIYAISTTLVSTPAVVAKVVQRTGKVLVRGHQHGITADIQLPADALTGLIRIAGYAQQIIHEETHASTAGMVRVLGYQGEVTFSGEPPPASGFSLRPNAVYTPTVWSTAAQRIKNSTSPYLSRYNSLKSYADGRLSQTSNAPAHYVVQAAYQGPDRDTFIQQAYQLQSPMFAAYSCAAVYYIEKLKSGTNPSSSVYANKARDMMMNWANNNTSTSTDADNTSLVMSHAMPGFLDAAELIYDYSGWTSAQKTTFANWVRDVVWPCVNRSKLRGLQANSDGSLSVPSFIDPSKPFFTSGGPYYNNHNCHGVKSSVFIAKYLQDTTNFNKDINAVKSLIGFLIKSDGSLPSEIARGADSILYTGFALEPLTSAAELIRNCGGQVLFDYETPTNQPRGTFQGGSLRKALNYVYNNGVATPSNWPQQSAVGNFGPHLAELLFAMGQIYQVAAWRNWAVSATGSAATSTPDLDTGPHLPLPLLMEHVPF